MTVSDNPVSLRLLEGLCAELRARVEAQSLPKPKFLDRIQFLQRVAKNTARTVTLLISAWWALGEI